MAERVTIQQLQEMQRKMSDRITAMEHAVNAMVLAVTQLFGDSVPAKLKKVADRIEENEEGDGAEDDAVIIKPKTVIRLLILLIDFICVPFEIRLLIPLYIIGSYEATLPLVQHNPLAIRLLIPL